MLQASGVAMSLPRFDYPIDENGYVLVLEHRPPDAGMRSSVAARLRGDGLAGSRSERSSVRAWWRSLRVIGNDHDRRLRVLCGQVLERFVTERQRRRARSVIYFRFVSEPSVTAVKTLFALSRNQCFFPACEQYLADPTWKRVKGEVAHIKGEKRGSARYDERQSEPDRQGYVNLMLLCPNHHKTIDWLDPDAYPPELLIEIKERHISHGAPDDWTDEATAEKFAVEAVRYAILTGSPGSRAETLTAPQTQPQSPPIPPSLFRRGPSARRRAADQFFREMTQRSRRDSPKFPISALAAPTQPIGDSFGIIAQGPYQAFTSHALTEQHLLLHVWFERPPSLSLSVEVRRVGEAGNYETYANQVVQVPPKGITETVTLTRPPAGEYQAIWLVEGPEDTLSPVALHTFST